MIELNLSYEESKKIVELGYDFRNICREFYIKHDKGCGWGLVEEYFIRINNEDDVFPFNESIHPYGEVWDYAMSLNSNIIKELTPLIPKAALEACLPTGLSFGLTAYGYLRYDYDVGEFQYYENPDYYYDDGTIHYGSKFEHEIFTWLHENYPEELKAKFDEVMA
jgi:hypothetical protein